MAPSPPSRVPSKRRRFAEMQSAAPQIAPERMRKAIGKGLHRIGTKDHLSAISTPRPNAESANTAIVESIVFLAEPDEPFSNGFPHPFGSDLRRRALHLGESSPFGGNLARRARRHQRRVGRLSRAAAVGEISENQ